MDGVSIEIDTTTVDLACVRFIYNGELLPGSRRYSLTLLKEQIDKEMLSFAELSPVRRPTEKQVRDWVYWLGHIVSRFCDPEDCKSDCWVINDVQSVSESDTTFTVNGHCSPWIGKP